MSTKKGRRNFFYIAGGVLFLLSFLFMPQHLLNNPLYGAFEAAIGILLIIMGFSLKSSVHIIAIILGLLISLSGSFGVYFSVKHPETNSTTDVISACLLAFGGFMTLIGSIRGLFRKRNKNQVDFDIMRSGSNL